MQNSQKTKVIVHVGHPKTGSSYIQQSLFDSSQALFAAGIDYPVFAGPGNDHEPGPFRMYGNCGMNTIVDLARRAKARPQPANTLLFSAEGLYWSIVTGKCQNLKKLAEEFDVKVVLFVRDPFEYVLSLHGQHIKNGSTDLDFGDALQKYNPARDFVRFSENINKIGVPLIVENYSAVRKNILDAFCRMAGIDRSLLSEPKSDIVNRSFTRGEIQFNLALIRHIGSEARTLITIPLRDKTPEIRSEPPYCPADAVQNWLEATLDDVREANKRLPAHASFREQSLDDVRHLFVDHPDELLTFTPRQIEIIAGSLGRALARRTKANQARKSRLSRLGKSAKGAIDAISSRTAAKKKKAKNNRAQKDELPDTNAGKRQAKRKPVANNSKRSKSLMARIRAYFSKRRSK